MTAPSRLARSNPASRLSMLFTSPDRSFCDSRYSVSEDLAVIVNRASVPPAGRSSLLSIRRPYTVPRVERTVGISWPVRRVAEFRNVVRLSKLRRRCRKSQAQKWRQSNREKSFALEVKVTMAAKGLMVNVAVALVKGSRLRTGVRETARTTQHKAGV